MSFIRFDKVTEFFCNSSFFEGLSILFKPLYAESMGQPSILFAEILK